MRVYVAGKYSAGNVMDVLDNMRVGMRTATELFLRGYHPFVPWFDYHFIWQSRPDIGEKGPTLENYYEHGLDWLSASDVLYVLEGYEGSRWTHEEIRWAKDNNIPVYYEDTGGIEGFVIWAAKHAS